MLLFVTHSRILKGNEIIVLRSWLPKSNFLQTNVSDRDKEKKTAYINDLHQNVFSYVFKLNFFYFSSE